MCQVFLVVDDLWRCFSILKNYQRFLFPNNYTEAVSSGFKSDLVTCQSPVQWILGLWLVYNDASDWSISRCPGEKMLDDLEDTSVVPRSQAPTPRKPLIGHQWSYDLNTGLRLVNLPKDACSSLVTDSYLRTIFSMECVGLLSEKN